MKVPILVWSSRQICNDERILGSRNCPSVYTEESISDWLCFQSSRRSEYQISCMCVLFPNLTRKAFSLNKICQKNGKRKGRSLYGVSLSWDRLCWQAICGSIKAWTRHYRWWAIEKSGSQVTWCHCPAKSSGCSRSQLEFCSHQSLWHGLLNRGQTNDIDLLFQGGSSQLLWRSGSSMVVFLITGVCLNYSQLPMWDIGRGIKEWL